MKWAEPTRKGRVKPDHKVQLAAFALMPDENRKATVKREAIYYRRVSRPILVPINLEDKRNVWNMCELSWRALKRKIIRNQAES